MMEIGEKGKTNNTENHGSMVFRPIVLTAVPEEMGKALMDEAHMEGLVMQKCSQQDIRYSNAFMVATMKDSSEPTEKYYKIQDKVFFNAFSKICRNKHFCNEEQCWKNDAIAAEFIMEHDIESASEYKGIKNITPIEISGRPQKGIHYICPLTELDEIALPVRLYDRSMGVLIVGQISTNENRAALEARIREKLPDGTSEDAKDNAENVISSIEIETGMEKLIGKIYRTVEQIEDGLIEYYNERQNQYVLKKSSELIKKFKEDVRIMATAENSSENVYPAAGHMRQYESIGACIKEHLYKLCDTVGAANRIVFTPTYDNLVNNEYDEIVCEGITFDFGKWKADDYEKNAGCGNIEKYLNDGKDKFDLLFVASAPSYPIAMAVCSRDFLGGITAPESNLLKRTFYDTFCKFAEYAQMVGMEAKSDYYRIYLDNYMSVMRHELGQSNAGYQMLIEEFKKHRNRFTKNINRISTNDKDSDIITGEYLKQCDNFIRDSESYLHTTMMRIQSTKYLIDFSNIDKVYFYPYEAFLFKWNQIYGMKSQSADLVFQFPNVILTDYLRPRMYGDPLMIEQAAYNLTNNAIKYALPGTTVSLDCRLNRGHSRYEIIVENLGSSLKNDSEAETLFHFGKRGSNNKKAGSGLGLFLTKQIAKAHGGDVSCEVEKLSEFNWTLMRLYLEFYEAKNIKNLCKDENLYRQIKQEWEEKQNEISQVIVKEMKNNAFTPMYVDQHIQIGTTRFKFTFWIPHYRD